jgi:MOSC domain-containing protein YiiM
MNEPRMAALLVAQGRPGFYFRVLEEGEVEAGDEIVKVALATQGLLLRPGQRQHGRDSARSGITQGAGE